MKIGIIVGSHRKDSQSAKVGRFLNGILSSLDNVNSWTLDLGKTPLPLWDEELWSNGAQWAELPALKAELDACDGFVVIAPEWHGMVPAALKNFFLLWAATGELSHKPALACAVSASDGGAYVIAELRMSSYKNNRLCWIPEHLIARHVKTLGNEDDALNDASTHEAFQQRALYALKLLVAYADALGSVRAAGLIDHETFMNGM
mgnify:FL=1